MELRRYNPSDLQEINSWYTARGQSSIPESLLPEVGYVVRGIAAGFLYQTDSGIALLEGFAANPKASAAERDEALDLITAGLVKDAESKDFKMIMALTTVDNIYKRALKHGFEDNGYFRVLNKKIDKGQ